MREAFYERRSNDLTVGVCKAIDFPAHFHESLEILYALTDYCTVTVGSKTVQMRKGDLVLIFSNNVHSYSSVPEQRENTRALLCIVPLSQTGEFRQVLTEMSPENPFLQHSQLHPDVIYALDSLEHRDTPPNMRAERALIQLILSRSLPMLNLYKSRVQESLLYQTVDFLSNSYHEAVTLDDLSHKLGVSRYTVSRLFSEKFGCGFPEYVNRLRLNEAENLLVNTDSTITDISFHCGFETPRTFNRAFLKQCGMTPREFRQRKK